MSSHLTEALSLQRKTLKEYNMELARNLDDRKITMPEFMQEIHINQMRLEDLSKVYGN